MNLELSPNEYLNTSRDLYERAEAYQNARSRGIEDAREEQRKAKEREAKVAAAKDKLRGR